MTQFGKCNNEKSLLLWRGMEKNESEEPRPCCKRLWNAFVKWVRDKKIENFCYFEDYCESMWLVNHNKHK